MLTCEKAVAGVLSQLGRTKSTHGNYFFHLLAGTMKGSASLMGAGIAEKGREKFLKYQDPAELKVDDDY